MSMILWLIVQVMKTWDLREETIKYCEQDVVTLYQVINKFNEQIFILFRIDILKYPTLPSLAFAIYRSKFIGDARIPLIDGFNVWIFSTRLHWWISRCL